MGRYPQAMKMKPETCEREGQPEGDPQGGRTQTPKSSQGPCPIWANLPGTASLGLLSQGTLVLSI